MLRSSPSPPTSRSATTAWSARKSRTKVTAHQLRPVYRRQRREHPARHLGRPDDRRSHRRTLPRRSLSPQQRATPAAGTQRPSCIRCCTYWCLWPDGSSDLRANQLSASSAQGAPPRSCPRLQPPEAAVRRRPQTPKPIQPPLEIWNKLRFWFNDDVRLSIASVSIPFGQRFISIDLAPQSNLIYEFPASSSRRSSMCPASSSHCRW